VLHHFALGRDALALGKVAGGDLGAELADDLHVERDRALQLGRSLDHVSSC
jgi:hypothetical protein